MFQPKKYVLGYYVLKSGVPCTLDLKLDSHGLLVPSKNEQVTVFLRADLTLWGVKTRVARAVLRTERRSEDIARCSHLEFGEKVRAIFRSGKYIIKPCRNPIILTLIRSPEHQAQSDSICAGTITVELPHAIKPKKAGRGQTQLQLAALAVSVIADL